MLSHQDMPEELVRSLSFQIDLVRLRQEATALIERVGWPGAARQISLTHTPACPPAERYAEGVGSLYDHETDIFRAHEKDFSVFHEELHGSYLHWIYLNVPFAPARMRLMSLLPKTCLSLHDDTGPRYHIALQTNPSCYMVFPEQSRLHHIPSDGRLYRMDAERLHTAINADRQQERLHLVFSDKEFS